MTRPTTRPTTRPGTTADGASTGASGARPLTPAGARVLEVASELFYTRGIRAVGVETIAEVAGVTKKTLYDRFGSKDALVAAYLQARDDRWRAWLGEYLDAAPDDPRARVLAVFDALDTWMRTYGPRGCGFVNAFAELPDPDHPGHHVAAAQKQWLRATFTEMATAAGAAEPEETARALLVLHEGATVAYSTGVDPDAASVARDVAARLLP
jgi:AcrR family transcriptional regulator